MRACVCVCVALKGDEENVLRMFCLFGALVMCGGGVVFVPVEAKCSHSVFMSD